MKNSRYRTKIALESFLKDKRDVIQGRIKVCKRFIEGLQNTYPVDYETLQDRLEALDLHEGEVDHIDKWITKINEVNIY